MATEAVQVRTARLPWAAARVLGALSLLAIGIIHLQQYFKLYSGIPTIGSLFVLNFAGAAVVSAALLAPLGRWTERVRAVSALAGIGIAATSYVFLYISERTPLFGFKEPGFDPSAIMATQIAEVATVVFLGAFLLGRRR
jgi:glucan phosphoethanolaminetransferase (alkaline phosphatase superfamily)